MHPLHVSLMPEQGGLSGDLEIKRRYQVLVLTAGMSVLAAVVLILITSLLVRSRASQMQSLNAELATVQTQIKAEKDRTKDFDALLHALKVSGPLLDAHVDPLPLFRELERMTIRAVSYRTIPLREDTVSIEVVAPNYQVAARQVLAYHQASEIFSKVSAPSFRGDEKLEDKSLGVTFTATMTLKPGVLKFR